MAPAWSSALYCRDAHHQLNSFDEKRHITDTRFAVDTAAQRSFSLSGHGSTNSLLERGNLCRCIHPCAEFAPFRANSAWTAGLGQPNARASTSFACRLAGFAAADGIQSCCSAAVLRSA